MRIHNLYADENGESHFRYIDTERTEHDPDGAISGRLPATGICFRTTPADWFFSWHAGLGGNMLSIWMHLIR
jgi:hypothetical protein